MLLQYDPLIFVIRRGGETITRTRHAAPRIGWAMT